IKPRINDLPTQADEQDRIAKLRPADAQLQELRSAVAKRTDNYQKAQATVIQLKAQIEQLRSTAAFASTATAAADKSDTELSTLEAQLERGKKAGTTAASSQRNELG